ncbi:MAG: urease accessory protein UreE [Cyanobacteria bacterium P01_A01_bin.84]
MFKFTERLLAPNPNLTVNLTLSLTAEERTRSRHRFTTEEGLEISLALPRGIVLQHGDILEDENQTNSLRILALPEPVLTVTSHKKIDLIRAAYHLGNRHVPLEINNYYLRLSPDPVLHKMLQELGGLDVNSEIVPFQPEMGAYGRKSHTHE